MKHMCTTITCLIIMYNYYYMVYLFYGLLLCGLFRKQTLHSHPPGQRNRNTPEALPHNPCPVLIPISLLMITTILTCLSL